MDLQTKQKPNTAVSQEDMFNQILSTMQAVLQELSHIKKKLSSHNAELRFDKKYVTTREACTMLACSRTMLWKMVKDETIKKYKHPLNGSVQYATEEIQKIIEAGNDPHKKWLLRNK